MCLPELDREDYLVCLLGVPSMIFFVEHLGEGRGFSALLSPLLLLSPASPSRVEPVGILGNFPWALAEMMREE